MEEVNGHYSLNARVLCRIVEDEAVLLDLDSGQYYGLNAAGTRIWQLVGAAYPVSSIWELLAREFEVLGESAAADVQAFIELLLAKRLVIPEGETGATG